MKKLIILFLFVSSALFGQVNLKYINVIDSLEIREQSTSLQFFQFDATNGITFPDGTTQLTAGAAGRSITSEILKIDTISSNNNSFVYFDSTVVIEDTLKTPLIYTDNEFLNINTNSGSNSTINFLNNSSASISVFETDVINLNSGYLKGGSAVSTYWYLRNSTATSSTPNIIPNSTDQNTGIGWAGVGQLALVAGNNATVIVTDTSIIVDKNVVAENVTADEMIVNDSIWIVNAWVTGVDTSGNVSADTGTFNVLVLGGSTPVDTSYSSDYVMENTVVDSIQVNKTIRYNESEGVHEFLTGKDEVVWQGALEDLFQFYNNTGQTITNGTPLYYSGVNGDSILTCDYATAAIEFTVLRYAGLATGDVLNADWGFGNVRGKVRDYNTTALSKIGAVFLGNDSLPTMTKPAYPSEVLILGGVIEVAVNGILYHDPSFALKRELESRDYSFTTQGILSGIYYKGGYYDWSATDANLTQASTTQTYGTASVAYSAHGAVVCGGVGSTDAGVVGLRVTGTSIDDNGVRTASDADTIITDITAVATDEYYESKKWIGTITYELITISGSPTTYSLDFNYGFAKYEDANNNDYYLVGLEVVGLAGATDTDFNIELLHHTQTGWTYAATGFVAGNGTIASWATDLAPEDNLSSGVNFSWKRSNLTQFIDGNGSEGAIFRITTGASASVQSMDLHILIALD